MIENRELTIDDYLAMLRRRMKVILIPTLLAPLGGIPDFLRVPAKYTSQVAGAGRSAEVPEGSVQPVVTEDLAQRIATMQQQVLGRNRLQPMVERLGLVRGRQEPGRCHRRNSGQRASGAGVHRSERGREPGRLARRSPGQATSVPGFTVNYTGPMPKEAQSICNELTSMLLTENSELARAGGAEHDRFPVAAAGRSQARSGRSGLASWRLSSGNTRSTAGRRRQQPEGAGDLNSQLDANTQTLNRAQQDKAYTESLLAQQLAAWKSSQGSSNPQSLQQQLTQLQTQLLTCRPDTPRTIRM